MSKKDNVNQKGTDRDVRPQQGQKSNENWDDKNTDQRSSGTFSGRGSDEEINRNDVSSTQGDQPERGENLTGPGLG